MHQNVTIKNMYCKICFKTEAGPRPNRIQTQLRLCSPFEDLFDKAAARLSSPMMSAAYEH